MIPIRFGGAGNKYKARKVFFNGETFDSQWELQRWRELQFLERKGVIHDLQRQIRYVLIPKQRDEQGRTVFRETAYVADFVYWDDNGLHVEDAKGVETEVFKIKRKLMYERFNILIEVTKR